MEKVKLFYRIDELEEIWDGITESDILQLAAKGVTDLYVWFDGTAISVKENGSRVKQKYCNLAKLPLEEAQKFVFEEGITPKTLLGKDGEILTCLQLNKYEGIYWRHDLCMLPEEKERLDAKFLRVKSEPFPDRSKAIAKKINPKAEQTLLKIIGALLHIHYNRSPYMVDGKPNAQRIEEGILSELGEDLIKIDGLRDGTIRKKIPAAFESIKEYTKA